MIKYTLDYTDTENVPYHIDIDVEGFSGSSTEIGGYAVYEFADIDDITEVIRGSSLSLILEADTGLTFEDLYIEDEQSTKVTLYRDGVVLFIGWVNPDGIFQDWVNDRWDIEITCSDGLAYLEDLGYDDFGTPIFRNRDSEIKILSRCLAKTGLDLPIYTMLSTVYAEQSPGDEPLLAVNDQDRFIKEDDETNMACKDIIESILGKYRAYIKQYNGAWYIMEIYDAFTGNNKFRRYNSSGVLQQSNLTIDTAQTIGTYSKGFYPHHAKDNQKIEIEPSISAYRINYKYGKTLNQQENSSIYYNGSSYSGWTAVNYIEDNNPLTVSSSGSNNDLAMYSTQDTEILLGQSLNISAKTQAIGQGTYGRIRVSIRDNSDVYFLNQKGVWGTFDFWGNRDIAINIGSDFSVGKESSISIDTEPAPITGDLRIEILRGGQTAAGSVGTQAEVQYLDVSWGYSAGVDVQGETWTFNKINKTSSIIKNTQNVDLGDGERDYFTGTIYQKNGIDSTTTWLDKGRRNVEGASKHTYVPIINNMGFKTMLFNSFPTKKFSGGFYGYLKPFEKIRIDGISDSFMILKYKYNTKTNEGELEAREVYPWWSKNSSVGYIYFNTINSSVSLDTGNSTEPTI